MGDDIYKKKSAKTSRGLKVERHFSKENIPVFDLFKYEMRSSCLLYTSKLFGRRNDSSRNLLFSDFISTVYLVLPESELAIP